MAVNDNTHSIGDVSVGDTFEEWRTKTNDEIIEKLNLLKVYTVLGGNGVSASIEVAGGILHIGLGTTCDVGISFSAPITFGETVTFNNDRIFLNADDNPNVGGGVTYSGIVIGPKTFEGLTADGYSAYGGEYHNTIRGYTGHYLLAKDGYWFTESDLGLDSMSGTKIRFGEQKTNNHLIIKGPGQGSTTDQAYYANPTAGGPSGPSVEGPANRIKIENNWPGTIAQFNEGGYVDFLYGVNKKRIKQANHGFSFGHAIRLDATYGYTLAFAGATEGNYETKNAEVIGLVSDWVDNDTFDVAFTGEITGNFPPVVGSVLSTGCVYYLDKYTRGKYVAEQPNSVGLTLDSVVSKPVLLATSATAGVILQYRGQEIFPDTALVAEYVASGGALGTADVYNTHRISIVNSAATGYDSPAGSGALFNPGDIVTFDTSIDGYTLASNLKENARTVVGMVGATNDSLNTATVITSGLVNANDFVSFDWTGLGILNDMGGITQDDPKDGDLPDLKGGYYKPICTVLDSANAVIHVGGVQAGWPTIPNMRDGNVGRGSSGGGSRNFGIGSDTEFNHLINGSFDFWRRGNAVSSAYTGTGDIYTSDRWKRVSDFTSAPHGATPDFSIQRIAFNESQKDVPGFPKYYMKVKGTYATGGAASTGGYETRLEQRIEDSRKFDDRVMTLSLYAMGVSGGHTGSIGLFFLRSTDGSSVQKSLIGKFNIDTTLGKWERKTITFTTTPATGDSYSVGHYCGVAISTFDQDEGIEYNDFLHLSQVRFQEGGGSEVYDPTNIPVELERCNRFYRTSYDYGNYPGDSTMVNSYTPDNSPIVFTATPTMQHMFGFLSPMRITPPKTTLNVYSPTGKTASAFNITARKDLGSASSTKGYLNIERKGGKNIDATISSTTPTGIVISIEQGAVALDEIAYHFEADAEL